MHLSTISLHCCDENNSRCMVVPPRDKPTPPYVLYDIWAIELIHAQLSAAAANVFAEPRIDVVVVSHMVDFFICARSHLANSLN